MVHIRPIPTPLAALLVALLLPACGGGGSSGPKPQIPQAPVEEAKAQTDDPTKDDFLTLGENPKWVPLKEMFESYRVKKIEDLANPLLDNLVNFVPEPPIEERDPNYTPPKGWIEEDPLAAIDVKDPRKWLKLERYKLVLLMTGTSQPKAVVMGRSNMRLTVKRGDPLGKEGGYVKAILQYKMLVTVPGEREPRVLSIEPPLSDLARAAGPANDF